MVEVHERYVRSLEQAGTLNRELEFLPTDEGFDERQAAGGGLTAARVRDPALAHEDRARPGAARLRPAGRPVPLERARALLPDAPARGVRGAAPAPPAAARDHRLAGRQRPRQPRRDDLRLPARRRDRRGRRRHRARLHRCARGLRAARPLGRDRGARRARARGDADRDAAQGAHPARAATRWLLRNRRRPLDIAATVARYAPGAAALAEALPALLGPAELEAAQARPRRLWRSAFRPSSRSVLRTSRRSYPRSSSSRSRRRPSWTSRRRRRSTSRSARGSSCTGCATGSSTCPGDALGGDGARRASRRRLLRAGGSDCRGAAVRRRCRALAGRERRRDRALAAGARGHQDRRHPRPRPAVGRRARDAQPDPLERHAGAGRTPHPGRRGYSISRPSCESSRFSITTSLPVAFSRLASIFTGQALRSSQREHGLPLLVEQGDGDVAARDLTVPHRLPPLEEVGAAGDAALQRDVRVRGAAGKLASGGRLCQRPPGTRSLRSHRRESPPR